MDNIKIVEFQPREGLKLKAVELDFYRNSSSPCCTRYKRIIYCQNRLAEETWSDKTDASFSGILDHKIKVLNNYIVIPELDKILRFMQNMDISNIQVPY